MFPSWDGARAVIPGHLLIFSIRGDPMRGKQIAIMAVIALAVTVGYTQYLAKKA